MADHDAFLADLSAFLSEFEASTDTRDVLQRLGSDHLVSASRQLLSETERLVDDEEDASAMAMSSNDSEDDSSSTTARRNRLAAKRTSRYRRKLKSEKQLLKQRASELSAELSDLRSSQASEKKTKESIFLSAWRTVAKREKEKRLEVEQQQKRLRAAVVNRARLIHQMKLLAQEDGQYRRLTAADELLSSTFEGEELLKSFLEQLDPLYAQTNKIFREVEFDPSSSVEYQPKREGSRRVEYFESTDAIVIPFELEKAADAMSSVMLADFDGECYEGVKDPENTTAVRYNINYCCQSGENVSFVAYIATKRYEEGNRVVFVWRMLMEGQGKFAGLHADETGWVVVRNSNRVPNTDPEESPSTVGEIYSRLIPTSLAGQGDRAEQFTKIAIKSSEEELKQITEVLDNLLLDAP